MSAIRLLPRELDRRTGLVPPVRTRWTLALPLPPAEPEGLPVPEVGRDVRVKIASTRDEWEQAFQLVTAKYQARGYEEAGTNLRFTSYHALPDTVVLVAKAGGFVTATFTLVPDSRLLGLPLENLYPAEVRELRRAGRRIVETTSLADRGLGMGEFVHVFQAMMRLAFQYGFAQGADTSVITVNPRHRLFYTKLLGYASLGPRRAYAPVRGAPAEALFIDLAWMRACVPAVCQQMFGRPLPSQALRAARMPADVVRQFARRSSQTDPRLVEEILTYAEAYGSPRAW